MTISPTFYNEEGARIAFVIQSRGMVAALKWAKQTRSIYRAAVLDKTHHASTRRYRVRFIASYLMLKNFINAYEPVTHG